MSRRSMQASKRFLEVEHPHIAEKLDYAEIVRRQIDRCLQSAADEAIFAAHVLGLEALIPEPDVTEEYKRELEDSVEQVEIATPVMNCGIPIDTNVIAAQKQIIEEINWVKRFNAAINLFSSMGITWRRVPTTAF